MSWVAVAAAGAAVIGGGLSYMGNRQASEAAQQGGQAAIDEQRRQFDTLIGLGAPYQTTGVGANNALARLFGLPYQNGPTQISVPQQTGGSGGGGNRDRQQLNPIGGDFAPALPNVPGLPNFMQPGHDWDPISRGINSLLGGGGGDTERFNASRPQGAVGNRYQPSDVVRLLNQGVSIDDIASRGWLSPLEGAPDDRNDREINYLLNSGLTSEQIGRLQGRQPAPGTGASAPVTPTGPDMSVFFQSPGYQFRRNEGQRDIQNVFAARGGAASGNALRALTEFNQNLASNEFGNFVNTLMGLSGRGQQQAQFTGNAAVNTGQNIGNLLTGMGNARASGIAGQYQGINDSIQGGVQNWLLSRYLRGG